MLLSTQAGRAHTHSVARVADVMQVFRIAAAQNGKLLLASLSSYAHTDMHAHVLLLLSSLVFRHKIL